MIAKELFIKVENNSYKEKLASITNPTQEKGDLF